MSNMVILFDTTLRDGAQREGLTFSVEDKLKIAEQLDRLGIDYIEGGMPAANPKDLEFFKRAQSLKLKTAKVVAFGSTRYKNTIPADDKGLKILIESGAKVACIVGKSWSIHVKEALKTNLEENLCMVEDSIRYLKEHGLEVFFDAEHFFDGYKDNKDYSLKVLEAAQEAGVDYLVLCDTNGGTLPDEIGKIVSHVSKSFNTPVAIHAHNDSECAVANSLMAVENGASQVQGTINGYGERCGNANLISIIPSLILKIDKKTTINRERLKLLSEVSHFVSEIANVTMDNHQPFVGQSAFAHKGGLHVSAISQNEDLYQHIKPEEVGNMGRILISELSGKSSVVIKAKELGIDLKEEPEKVQEILSIIKEKEHFGYHFEAADGSFEILLEKKLAKYKPLFKLESFRVIAEKREDGNVVTEATVKVNCQGKERLTVAEGNGPVNALDLALRKAIEEFYPDLKEIQLTDYKVRVLNEKQGTGAVVRVLIETTDGEKSWGTIGVHENIIEASWEALVDSLQYGLTRE